MHRNKVIAIGPGSAGRWPNGDYGDASELHSFAEHPQVGDLVVAKHGKRTALAIGVLGPYDFDEDLDDIEGWDLCHFRRVNWLPVEPEEFRGLVLAQSRFSGCRQREVVEWVERSIAGMALDPPDVDTLAPIESRGPRLDTDTLDAELRQVIERARRWHDYTWGADGFGGWPSEKEFLTHITVPFLEALGWPAAQIAIEWNRWDIALFSQVSRANENCRVIIEGKRVGAGLHWAEVQGKRYADKVGHQVYVVVTDGIRYKLLRPHSDELIYAHLVRPRESAECLFDALRCPPA
jgi:hypothetical protein